MDAKELNAKLFKNTLHNDLKEGSNCAAERLRGTYWQCIIPRIEETRPGRAVEEAPSTDIFLGESRRPASWAW